MAKPMVDTKWNPLGAELPADVAEERRIREAENVLGSYFQASDLLAEALQNATDAIDAHTAERSDAPRLIHIDFDVPSRRFAVADTGTGMSREALDIAFQPNVTLKAGRFALPTSRRWRGEKGVGLSFLLFAGDELAFRTCDGRHRYDAVIEGANSWAKDPNGNVAYTAQLTVSEPDEHLGSDRYTILSIGRVDFDRFDRDLFELSIDEVDWILRTRTAVGNTAPLFADVGVDQPDDIDVTLKYRAAGGDEEPHRRHVPYSYATPEYLLSRAEQLGVAPGVRVYDLEDVADLPIPAMRRQLRNAAVRYVDLYESGDADVPVYFFAMEGNAMAALLRQLAAHDKVSFVPPTWQGFWVATRDMPTGIPLRGGILPTRAYEQRVFGLLQRDDLRLDLGRKSLPGGTVAAFNAIIRAAWQEDLRWVVERIPRVRRGTRPGVFEIERRLRAARKLDDLRARVPYLKVPDRRSAVAAVFHEFLGTDSDDVPDLRPLATGVFQDDDALVYAGEPNQDVPLHVVFGLDHAELLAGFDADDTDANLPDLAVVWTLETEHVQVNQISVEPLAEYEKDGATHVLDFGGLGGREEPLRTVVLRQLLGGS